MDYPITGEELINDLTGKLEMFPIFKEEITKAINILNVPCWLRLKRSTKYWNKIVSERMNIK
jgi:hypothetical protein